ncbi:MAG: glycerol-3-phosphate 1-O-acyltransferase PlsY [Clostridia bacterium]|nr:glycerol-3-phosphate 1-O-acyltransferase PlsY [Clostridia bacterium]
MNIWLKYILIIIAGYLLGNISLGIFIARAYGIKDIRKVGSGNAGTTNVLRNLGWVPSVLTLIGDCLKGLVAAELGYLLAGDIGLILGGTFAVIGHDFPVFFKFKGGKGIATSLGLIIAVNPWIALILTVIVIAVVAITHYMSVGSILACFLYPTLMVIFKAGQPNYAAFVLSAFFAGALALFQHRANLRRLVNREENKLNFQKITEISKKLGQKNK